jgi:membrane glycosyltransferase
MGRRVAGPFHSSGSGLAALAARFGRPLAILGEVAAAAAMAALLALIAILGLLLPAAIVVVLVALLACLDVLFVASALIGHSLLLCHAPRDKETNGQPNRSVT